MSRDTKLSKTKLLDYKTTAEISVPKTITEQILGQDEGFRIIKKAAKQRRNVLLVGQPGTGKSMLGQALAEQLPKEKLVDVLCVPNQQDENNPLIRIMPAGKGRDLITKLRLQSITSSKSQNILFFVLIILAVLAPWWIRQQYGDIMAAASLIGSMIFLATFVLFINLSRRIGSPKLKIPKLLIDNSKQNKPVFIDATGARAGALLGDVLHDPLQSLYSSNNINIKRGEKKVNSIINNLLKKHKNEIIKKGNYQATFLNKNELKILAEKNNKIKPTEVLSVNKYKSDKPYLYKITTESDKELIITPEHKVAIKSIFNKIRYIRADKLKPWHKVITLK